MSWPDLFFQAAFPLAIAFTPAIAGADNDRHFFSVPAEQNPWATQVYTLSAGDTVASVTKKYNVTPAALRKLNQFRTFAHGFDHLQPRDELDV